MKVKKDVELNGFVFLPNNDNSMSPDKIKFYYKKKEASSSLSDYKQIKITGVKKNKDNITFTAKIKKITLEKGKFSFVFFCTQYIVYGDNQIEFKDKNMVVTEGFGYGNVDGTPNSNVRHFLGKILYSKVE
jgi:hypothetical protein